MEWGSANQSLLVLSRLKKVSSKHLLWALSVLNSEAVRRGLRTWQVSANTFSKCHPIEIGERSEPLKIADHARTVEH